MSDFPNIDFSFRRGYNDAAKSAPYKEGSLNFIKDTGEFFVDKDGLRFNITSVIFDAGTEAQIRAIENPQVKLYLASDTHNILFFVRELLEWVVVGSTYPENAVLADKAIADEYGNNISSYYYTRKDATAEHTNIVKEIDSIKNSVGSIIRFDVKVLDSITSLPEEGVKGTIYCVPISDYLGYTPEDTVTENSEIMDNYIELLWVDDTIYGGYFEVVGTTHVNMSEFYKKPEVDAMLASLREEMLEMFAIEKAELLASINTIRSTVNSIQSSSNNRINNLSSTVNSLSGKVTTNGSEIESLKEEDETIKEDVSTNTSDISNIKSAIEGINSSIESINKNISNNALAIESAVAVNESQANTISGIQEDVADNTEDISKNTSDITTLKTDVEQLKTDTSTNAADIEGLESTIQETVDSSLTEIKNNISGIEQDIATNVTSIENLDKELDTLSGSVSKNTSDIATLRSDLNTTNSDIDAVEEDVAQNASDIDAVEASINSIKQQNTTTATQISNVTDTVTTLSNKVNTNTTNITDLDETKLESDLGEES